MDHEDSSHLTPRSVAPGPARSACFRASALGRPEAGVAKVTRRRGRSARIVRAAVRWCGWRSPSWRSVQRDQVRELARVEAVARPRPVDRHDVAGFGRIDEAGRIAPGLDALEVAGPCSRRHSSRSSSRVAADDQLVADALEDPARRIRQESMTCEDAVDLPAADEPDAGEDVEDVERMDRAWRRRPAWSPASASRRPDASRKRSSSDAPNAFGPGTAAATRSPASTPRRPVGRADRADPPSAR